MTVQHPLNSTDLPLLWLVTVTTTLVWSARVSCFALE
jgi:hypothetical protein